jgi:type II secretory ATPase GspE/PulE/Tfp pilus assembly ATPase PilB-like protein
MTEFLLADIAYGNYISPIKLVVILVLFFLWLPVLGWVWLDAKAVKTKQVTWTAAIFAAGAIATLVWLLLPAFAIGAVLYIIAVGASCVGYVMHRNSLVSRYDRVLTMNHFKSFFENKEKQKAAIKKGLSFVTANKNEVEPPEPKTPDFFGYKVASEIFEDALWRRTSEIVFVPTGQNYTLAYRIDGLQIKQPERTKEDVDFFIRFIKQLADLDINEKRKPQRGPFTLRKDSNSIQWEVNSAGSVAGEQIRIVRLENQELMKLENLGLNPDQLEPLKNLQDIKGGLVIVSGTKKSGVTSTFYAMLRNHDPFLNAVVTLERNPSGSLPNVIQNVYSLSDTGTASFSKRLQGLLRTGPDIVGIADCEDPQSALLAAQAAKNIRVYITLEAENTVQAVGKWLKLVNDQNLVASTLVAVTSQRLLRKLCPECRQAYEPNKDLLKKFNIPPEKIKQLFRQAEPELDKRGKQALCPKCQSTGFLGRFAVLETIVLNDELRNIIRQAKSLQDIATAFRRARMLFLQEQALRKVVDGTTAINELIREFSKTDKSAKPAEATQKL